MKGVIINSVLAVVGLVMAYSTWQKGEQKEKPAGEVTIFDCDKDKLQSITLEQKNKTIKLEMRNEDGKALQWFKIDTQKAPANQKDPKAAQPAKETEQFAGNDAAKEFAASMAPMTALRSLGNVEKNMLKELELEKPETTLSVQCAGQTRSFQVGGSTYGVGDRYIREKKGGPVYLLAAAAIRDLESASFRFMQRTLHTFELKDVDSVKVEAAGKKRELLQRNRREPEKAEWVDASAPDKRNELYGNWLNRLSQLRVQEYLAPGKAPGSELKTPASGSTPLATFEYVANGNGIGKLELMRVDAEPAEYYAKSEATKTWVKVLQSVAAQIDQDLPDILSGQSSSKESKGKKAKLVPQAAPGAAKSAPTAPLPHPAHP